MDCECGLPPVDNSGNTVLHYASASDSANLLLRLLSFPEIKTLMDEHNKVYTCMTHVYNNACEESLEI